MKVKERPVLYSQINQKTVIVTFQTLQQIFFYGHRGLQVFCHNVEAENVIGCRQK